MSLKTEARDIDGLHVTCSQLPAMRSYSVFTRLGKVLGPAIGALANATIEENVKDTDVKELAPAMAALLQGLADDESLVYPLLATVSVKKDGMDILLTDEANINLAFEGKFKALLLTLKFALEVNYADFFGDGLAALQGPKAKESD